MKCPVCNGETRVYSTKTQGLTVLRYRVCVDCHRAFRSWEDYEEEKERCSRRKLNPQLPQRGE